MGIRKYLKDVRRGIRSARAGGRADDFDWNTYHLNYKRDVEEVERNHSLDIKEGDYEFRDGRLVRVNDSIKPLAPNYRLIYETVLQLAPGSVFEMGCGWGHSLGNIGVLRPDIELNGVDISEMQIRHLKERHPCMKANVRAFDCTLPFPLDVRRVDIAFVAAVIMHIQAGNGHLVALSNLFRVASRQVILVENWGRHRFMDDIRALHEKRVIPWSEIHFHYNSDDHPGNRLMVVSSTPLPRYPLLTDYSILSGGA